MPEVAGLRGLAARFAALPQRRQELIGDAALAVALAAVNLVAVLPYQDKLHPLWLALVLVVAQAVPLAWRRAQTFPVSRPSQDRLLLPHGGPQPLRSPWRDLRPQIAEA